MTSILHTVRPRPTVAPRARRTRWAAPLAVLAVVGLLGAGCAPPAEPNWIDVQWLQDAGGTNDPVTGAYTGDWQQYVTSNGTTTGPTAAPSSSLLRTPPPFLITSLAGVGSTFGLPDGTARFPWNGRAGEGISVTTVPFGSGRDWVATFPGGTCFIQRGGPGTWVLSATPSPDGSRIAVTVLNNDFGGDVLSWVEVRDLTPGDCPVVTRVQYLRRAAPVSSGAIAGAAVTWSPSSQSILYDLKVAEGGSAIVRLDAVTGSTPSFVLAATEGCAAPLGWSYEDRILVNCYVRSATGVIQQSRIVSYPLGAGVTNVIDTFTAGPGTVATVLLWHYGYYAPGTNTVVFNKAVPVVDEEGAVQPWLQVHTVYDIPFAPSTPLRGSPPPLVWHQENTADVFEPVSLTHVPNMELVERWLP